MALNTYRVLIVVAYIGSASSKDCLYDVWLRQLGCISVEVYHMTPSAGVSHVTSKTKNSGQFTKCNSWYSRLLHFWHLLYINIMHNALETNIYPRSVKLSVALALPTLSQY